MPGTTTFNPSLYQKDMYKASFEVIDKTSVVHSELYTMVRNVKGGGDKNSQHLGMGALDRHLVEGQDIDFEAPPEGWSYYVKYWPFSKGLTLTFEAVQDTMKLGNYLKAVAATWTESEIDCKEDFAALPFNHGGDLLGHWVLNGSWTGNTDPSGNLMYDGKPLFNLTGNTRSTKGGGTYYNSVAGLTLSPSTFEQVYLLHTATNNRSELDRPKRNLVDTLLVDPSDGFMAKRIVETPPTQGLSGGQLNDKNIYYGLAKTIVWDYLTDGAFYVGKRQHRDWQFHERQAPLIDFFEDKNNKGYKASYYTRFGILLKSWNVFSRGGGSSA